MNKMLPFSFLILTSFILNAMETGQEDTLSVFQQNAPENYELAYAGKVKFTEKVPCLYFAFYSPTNNEPHMKEHKKKVNEYFEQNGPLDKNKELPDSPYYDLFKAKCHKEGLDKLTDITVGPVKRYNDGGTTTCWTPLGTFYFPAAEMEGSVGPWKVSLLYNITKTWLKKKN